MSKRRPQPRNEYEREFLELFKPLCEARSPWQVWLDIITAIACAISNSVPSTPDDVKEKREKEYAECINRFGGTDIPVKIFSLIVKALEANPWQNFLGDIFTMLGLFDYWKGQVFTPYHVCHFMAEVLYGPDVEEKIKQNRWISVSDPACGTGAMLIAAAEIFYKKGINYQQNVLFVAQDIDRTVGMMCYIQLSLLGCPGYVVIGNSITNPVTGVNVISPTEKEGQEFWYTPMYDLPIWFIRRFRYEQRPSLPTAQGVLQTEEADSENQVQPIFGVPESEWEVHPVSEELTPQASCEAEDEQSSPSSG